jgi:hypothetical protein
MFHINQFGTALNNIEEEEKFPKVKQGLDKKI